MPRNGSDSTRKNLDIILILVLLAIAGLLFAARFLYYGGGGGAGGTKAVLLVTVDGKEQGRYPLDRNNKILLGDKGWSNTLMIRDGKASVTEADCPDKICVHHAPIGRRGENIVCLPHKLVVEVVSPDEDQDGLDGITR